MARAYCPLCSKEINFRLPKRPTPRHVFQVAFTSLLAVWLLWPWLGIKGVVVFIPLWGAFEFIFRVLKRQQVVCTHCGFDPVLYKRDRKLARQKVEAFWAARLFPEDKQRAAGASSRDSSASLTQAGNSSQSKERLSVTDSMDLASERSSQIEA